MRTAEEILAFIADSPDGSAPRDALAAFIDGDANQVIARMKAEDLIQSNEAAIWYVDGGVLRYALTGEGHLRLAAFRQQQQDDAHKRAEDQAQKERDRLQAEASQAKDRWFNLASAVIGAVVGSAVTLLLQYFIR